MVTMKLQIKPLPMLSLLIIATAATVTTAFIQPTTPLYKNTLSRIRRDGKSLSPSFSFSGGSNKHWGSGHKKSSFHLEASSNTNGSSNGGKEDKDDNSAVAPNGVITQDEEEMQSNSTDIQKALSQLENFKNMALPYYKESNAGRWLFAGMIAMTLLNSGVSVAFSYIGKDFWNALSSKNPDEFYTMMVKFGGALVVGAPVAVLYRFQRERLAVHWREWMTDRTLQLYSSNRVYYALERDTENEIDNPDQRIAEDVRTFTAFSLELFLTAVTSIIDLVSFSFILYSIQPQLFGAIIAYAAFGTVTTTALGKKLVGLNFERLQKEADFRYSLVRIRDNAESIAFYAGEDIEGKAVSKRLNNVIENKREIIGAQRNLEFFTTAYRYLVQVVPVAVVAPQFFAGQIQLGVVSQSAGAFNHILNDLSVIVNQFEELSRFSAGIERLSQFMIAIRYADEERGEDMGLLQLPNVTEDGSVGAAEDQEVVEMSSMKNEVADDSATVSPDMSNKISLHQMAPMGDITSSIATEKDLPILTIENVTLNTPDNKRVLIQNLDLSIFAGQNLLIVGNSGAGKSSLLRAIAGLWNSGSGTITRPSDADAYFLPQRPYCAMGSLKDQLLYPSTDDLNPDDYPEGHRLSRSHLLRQSLTDQDLLDVFTKVDLEELPARFGDGDPIKGLSAVRDWSSTLSLGEQQRLAFGRLLVNRPRLVILDEATSALDMVAEAKMYGLLKEMGRKHLLNGGSNGSSGGLTRAGLTYVSVGHRPSLLVHHDVRLRLNGDEDYEYGPIEKAAVDVTPVVSNL